MFISASFASTIAAGVDAIAFLLTLETIENALDYLDMLRFSTSTRKRGITVVFEVFVSVPHAGHSERDSAQAGHLIDQRRRPCSHRQG